MYTQSTSNAVAGPSSAGLMWDRGHATLRMEDAIVETVVTHTTRTTTSYKPIALPRIPAPEDITVPDHLDGELYPLAREPCPADMQVFSLNLGGKRVFVQEGSPPSPSEVSAAGFSRRMPANPVRGTPRVGIAEAMQRTLKRPLESSRLASTTPEPSQGPSTPPKEGESFDSPNPLPPRKRVRGLGLELPPRSATDASAPLSPRPSPPPESASLPSMGSGIEAAALFSLPSIVAHYDALPDKLQQHVLMHLLRRSRMPTIQRMHAFAGSALRRDFIATLPHEIAVQVLQFLDTPSLAAAIRVSHKWRKLINGERSIWHRRLIEDGHYIGLGVEEEEEALIERRLETIEWKKALAIGTPSEEDYADGLPSGDAENCVPLKHVYRRRRTNDYRWKQPPLQYSFAGHFSQVPGHGAHVITCTQFDQDKIVTASDDNTVNIYDLRSGQRRKRLDGHEGGVWAMEFLGDTLVTGSTDRMVRIWDLETYETTHIFAGHGSTIRCLQIVEPVLDKKSGKYYPPFPIVITGSRDRTIRVWRLPRKGDPAFPALEDLFLHKNGIAAEDNPYHLCCLKGHTDAVRAVAAYGRICVSASYDATIRVWDLMKGKCLHVLRGHEGRVYSIVYDRFRKRCASGSVDNTVRVWDVQTGQCLQVLTGHTSLVGLLDMSPNYMVSAAADASLRVWDANTIEYKATLATNASSITCFAHDERKVVSGSDGSLKLWDITTGKVIRDLIGGVQSVWQVVFRDNILVAATNRGGNMVFEIFDFGRLNHISGVDDESLDAMRRAPWEKAKAGEFVGEYEGFATPQSKLHRQLALPAIDDWRLPSSSPGPAGPGVGFMPFGFQTPAVAASSGKRRSGRLAGKAKHVDFAGGSGSGSGKERRSSRKASSPVRASRGGSSLLPEASGSGSGSSSRLRPKTSRGPVVKTEPKARTRSQGTSFAPTFDQDEDEDDEDADLFDDSNDDDDMDDIQLIG